MLDILVWLSSLLPNPAALVQPQQHRDSDAQPAATFRALLLWGISRLPHPCASCLPLPAVFGTIVLYGYTQPACFHTQRNSYNPHKIMTFMIWTCWAALVLVGACTVLTYNFFPTSNSQKSW